METPKNVIFNRPFTATFVNLSHRDLIHVSHGVFPTGATGSGCTHEELQTYYCCILRMIQGEGKKTCWKSLNPPRLIQLALPSSHV